MASQKEAEEIVRRLTRKYGYLNEKMMSEIEEWKPEYRREIDENWLAMENTAAHSIKTFASVVVLERYRHTNDFADWPNKFMAVALVLCLNFFKTRKIMPFPRPLKIPSFPSRYMRIASL
jgi:hypothetical protein